MPTRPGFAPCAATGGLLLALLALPAPGLGAAKRARTLATTHITLYDCGLAQHERQARVGGAERFEIPVALAHLDDLLATLVLATDGGVKVREVRYPGVQNLGQAIAASGLGKALYESEEGVAPADLVGYVRALQGTLVEVGTARGRARTGTVIDCVQRDAEGDDGAGDGTGDAAPPPPYFVLLSDPAGAISWIPLEDVTAIAPVSPREARAVGSLAGQLGRATGFSGTAVVLETAAGSRGRLAASYVRQAPLWRTVYKISAGRDGVDLEAWALVHNDTDEDWDAVEMTLISGLPSSYVVSLASPRYREREVRTLEDEGGMMPQLGAETPDSLMYEWELPGRGGLGLSGVGAGGGGVGYGSSGGVGIARGGVAGTRGIAGESASSLVTVGQSAAGEEMAAAVEGEISTYRALAPVSIPAGSSALVPVLRRRLEGQAFTLLRQGQEPATCVRARNDTGLVLQAGLGSFYVHGRFRGQEELARSEPGEISLWCHGGDPDVRFTASAAVEHVPSAVEWRDGELAVHSLKKTAWTWDVENLAGQARSVALEARHIANGRVVSPEVVPGDSPGTWLHLFELEGAGHREVQVKIEEGVRRPVPVESKALREQAGEKALPAGQRGTLERAAGLLEQASRTRTQVAEAELDQERLGRRLERQRQNLAAVPSGSRRSRQVDRVVADLLAAEQAIRDGERKLDALRARAENEDRQARRVLEALSR